MPKRNRTAQVIKDNKDRWIFTYADLITMLLIFFILMYVMSRVDEKRFEALIRSVQQTVGGGGDIVYDAGPTITEGTFDPMHAEVLIHGELMEMRELLEVKEKLEKYIAERGLQDQIIVTLEERGVVISFIGTALFPLGSDKMFKESEEIIIEIGKILTEIDNYIRIEGHTDNLPINTPRFPSNWELSSARALAVLHKLQQESGIDPRRLSATGYGEYRPVKPNDTEETRKYNRRVDLVVLRDDFDEIESGDKIRMLETLKKSGE
ncbi:OmpA family protein [Peptococcaceae bacterium]|nr:OmpA family protein [Peptococcaceae bacterium]